MSKFRVKEDADELVKHSTFLVTINPNMAYTDADELLKARAELKGKVDTIFGENMDQYLVPYRVTLRGNVRSDMSIDEMNNYIIDGEIESRCEIGKIKKTTPLSHCCENHSQGIGVSNEPSEDPSRPWPLYSIGCEIC